MQKFPIQPGKHLELQTPLTLLHPTHFPLHVFVQSFPKYPLGQAGAEKKYPKLKLKHFSNMYTCITLNLHIYGMPYAMVFRNVYCTIS